MTSQINPNNIDGTYPVAGQANNTQGFRDNFTNIKTNFQYAEDEITDLQSKAVLKSALAGTTLDNNMSDNLIYAVKLQDVSYTYIALTATSGAINIDYSAASFQQISTTGSISLSFSNWPASGSAGTVRVGFNITDVAHTVTLPAAVSQGLIGLQGVSPGTPGVSNTITFGAVGNYAFEFVTIDGGTTVWIFDNSRPADVFSSTVHITSTEASTSTTTGALQVAGGVGIEGNLYVGGTIVGAVTVTGINVTGNAVAGNVNTSGVVSAVGNIVGGNINTAGRVTAVGNINGGNLNAAGLSLSGNVVSALNVTGNVTGGNVRSVGIMSAAGNITGGNIITVGALSTSGAVINSHISTTGNITTTGNIVMSGNLNYTPVFGQFTSTIQQGNPVANTERTVTFNTTDFAQNVSLGSSSQITPAKTGWYNIQTSVQVTKTDAGSDYITFWWAKNGTAIANSASYLRLTDNGDLQIFSMNIIQQLNAGQYVELKWSSPDTALYLEAIAANTTPTRPVCPSAIVTIVPVGA